jgi:HK97 family phage major capsid protein
MPGGNLTFNAQDVGAIVHYKNETGTIIPSQPGFNQDVKLAEKELVGLVPMSYRLLDNADYSVDVIVRDDLAAAMATREDIAFIRGDGTSDTPIGMRNRVFPAHVIADPYGNNPSLQDVRSVFANMMLQMRRANMPNRRLGWIISPRTEAYLMTITDGLGNPVFEREMIANRTLRNVPYRVSTQLPEDLGGSGLGTEIYLADFSQLLIGESKSIEFDVILDAAYDNGTGTIVSGVSSLQAVVRVVARHDFNVRYRKAMVIQNQVEWGA